MDNHQLQIINACAAGALNGELAFPEIVGKLIDIGIERYHADYSRQEITYYLPNGDSHIVSTPHAAHETATDFSADAVAAAVLQSQRNEHTYKDFVRKTMAAGCVGYFVQISGRCAIYFGRNGQSHVEHFPSAPIVTSTSDVAATST